MFMAKNALFDIGVNLIDDMFAGVYRGKLAHESKYHFDYFCNYI